MFPTDRYTPFGYLANPGAYARSWREGIGGALRSTDQRPGFGWWYPFQQRNQAGVALELGLEIDGRWFVPRADWAELGLHASHHGARLFTFEAAGDGLAVSASFFLAHADALVCVYQAVNGGAETHEVRLSVQARAWPAEAARTSLAEPWCARLELPPWPSHAVATDAPEATLRLLEDGHVSVERAMAPRPGEQCCLVVALGRGADPAATGRRALAAWPLALEQARAEDDRFWAGAARLVGDWPASWRRAWVYDLETARLCLRPAGGIYRDVWPAWSANWPRSVLAEATLDMLRLALGAPGLARRALLSLFRDAPAPNVPCLFQHGEPNMVAEDGQACGTSLAWCLPFHNLALLDHLAPERDWRAALYPFLAALLDWWLAHRADASGWLSYHCTWEAGEDDTPRLGPERRGAAVVDGLVRPVELQAAAAQAAALLQRWAEDLGRVAEARRWRVVARRYRRLTRALWEPSEQRFRDRDAQGRPLAPCGDPPYWGGDPCTCSVLALTAALSGAPTPAQRRALAREVERYLGLPWCEWPSWSWIVAEAAGALGRQDLASRLAGSILARVYPENDRRPTELDHGPVPGAAREWWPLDLSRWNAGEAYGWGGATALLLLRHVVGAQEAPRSREEGWITLAPGLPAELLRPGRCYGIERLPWQGRHLDLWYEVRERRLDALVRVRETGQQRRISLPNLTARSVRLW